MRPPRSRLGRALATGVLCAATALGTLATGAAPAQAADQPLRDLADAKGIHIGNALAGSKLTNNARYREIAATEFNSVTAENAMKWGVLEPNRGSYNWGEADQLVDFAEANGQQVRGHTLIWHSQNPGWLDNGDFSAAEMRQLMRNHIETTVGRYEGRIAVWDVVNEMFNDDGSFRRTIWYDALGPDYIAEALTLAHEADPTAKLYLNDYSVEAVNAKSTAMYNLARDLKARGVPLHGIGLQSHLILGQVPSTMQANIQRFADLGLDVDITELDVRIQMPASADELRRQADDYRAVFDACLAVSRCQGVTVWGVGDNDSWVPDVFEGYGAPLMYDGNYQAKPAYDAVAEALGGTTDPGDPGDPGDPPGDGCVADYAVANEWNSGFTGNVTIRCTGSSLSGWTATWDFPAGQRISHAWNASCTQSGARVTCTNVSWNGTVPAGGSTTFGFNATTSGSNPAPASITLS
ncbi:endo-1,4-beta-xylanase [Streptomyces sp. TRM 70351]|uniref:endo-1,4-beta-xylanase n=1 Tax=Streptomyces sp. TRM 70351 TaxID=3116552 RepID=UPI002E7C169C|nr:endo-1,4-beta-xylanase [Streptomyces sp. TRM 70351]MEE1927422.1 endo-1,4-beta-xylanase [Streptomyces sp. TRM 70351]